MLRGLGKSASPGTAFQPPGALLDLNTARGVYFRQRHPVIHMTLPVKLDHCVIHVSDWTRSNAFYEHVMGAEIVPRGKGFAYRFGDAQLNLHGPGAIGTPVARIPVAPGNSDLCFEWKGPIADAIAHLKQHEIAIEVGPVARAGVKGEGTSVYFRDPDGSLMEFISYAG